jgi:hypothetical protein
VFVLALITSGAVTAAIQCFKPKFGSWVIAAAGRIGGICGNGNARTGTHPSPGG